MKNVIIPFLFLSLITAQAQDTEWQTPKFYFAIQFPNLDAPVYFQEVTGLDAETQQLEYRSGNGQAAYMPNTPGFDKVPDVTLKKGMFKSDNQFWEWYNEVKSGNPPTGNMIVYLMDESGSPTMSWTLNNASASRISLADQSLEGNEVAVASINIRHQGIFINNE